MGTWKTKSRPSAKDAWSPSNFTGCNGDRGRACYEKGRGGKGKPCAELRAVEDSREPHTGMKDEDTGGTTHPPQGGCCRQKGMSPPAPNLGRQRPKDHMVPLSDCEGWSECQGVAQAL